MECPARFGYTTINKPAWGRCSLGKPRQNRSMVLHKLLDLLLELIRDLLTQSSRNYAIGARYFDGDTWPIN